MWGTIKLTKRGTFLVTSVAVGLAFASISAIAASNCKLVQIEEWPIRLVHNKLLIDGAVNGQKIGVQLDTGAWATLIFRSAAVRLNLDLRRTHAEAVGVGGETDIDTAWIDEVKIGQVTKKGWQMMVAGEHDFGDDVAVLLGEDFFDQVDVEFDLAHRVIRLFEPRDCDGASLAYWATDGASEVAIEPVDDAHPRIVLTVDINGQPVRAQLDSGAGISMLDKSVAARVGVTPETPGVVPFGTTMGLGQKSVDLWIGRFQTFAIGDEIIRNTMIPFGGVLKDWRRFAASRGGLVGQVPSMFLGVDFLHAHRVLVSHSQRKMYFTYSGGPVFQRVAPSKGPVDAGAEAGKSGPDRAIADHDASSRSDRQRADALIASGVAWYDKKDYDRAIADYDAALRIDPQYAAAFRNRGSARVDKGDFDQGIADLSRAIEINPKLAPAYVIRGNAKRYKGDLEGAIVDYTRAIEVDPNLAIAYNQLAWELATAEQPAIRDGRRAVESALKACELSQWKNSSHMDTLAAAYARAGNFEDAVKWEHKALEDPRLASDEKTAQRLRLYEEGKAWPPD